MSIRSRFLLFFLAGTGVALIPIIAFWLAGVLSLDSTVSTGQLAVAVGSATLLAGASTIALLIAMRSFSRPLEGILNGIRDISRGNLSPTFPKRAPAELGRIKDSLTIMCRQLQGALDQLGGLSKRVAVTTDGAGESFIEVQDGIRIQSGVAQRTFQAVGSMSDGLLTASGDIEEMASRIESSATQVAQMDTAISQVASSISGLTTIIEKASDSTNESNQNVQILSRDLASLTNQIHTASNALSEMSSSAEKAQADATNTAHLMGKLTNETERIGEAIEATIEGSDAIHVSNERIIEVTTSLQSRVDRVDDVLVAVHSLAERTKLLSINASIIASEAGEHGRAFAVVAREVKELAQSTATAIAEISIVLEGLKQGFSQTIKTIQSGQQDVDNGIRMARNAVVLLRTIPDKVQQAATLSNEIVETNQAQVDESNQVKQIIDKVRSTVNAVSKLLREQVSRNEHTLELFNAISKTAEQVMRSSTDHAQASSEVNRNVELISGDFRILAERVRENVSGLNNIVTLSEEVMLITDKNRRRSEELSALIGELNRFAEDLGDDSLQFSRAE